MTLYICWSKSLALKFYSLLCISIIRNRKQTLWRWEIFPIMHTRRGAELCGKTMTFDPPWRKKYPYTTPKFSFLFITILHTYDKKQRINVVWLRNISNSAQTGRCIGNFCRTVTSDLPWSKSYHEIPYLFMCFYSKSLQ